MHGSTSFESLKDTLPLLEQKIREKREAQRNLVKHNFEKFVGAKATIDSVFLEMQSQGLTSGDYGLTRAREAVQVASNRVRELYAPLLEDQQREGELRRKLAWIQRHRWLLEAPGKLQELRMMGDWTGFVRMATDLVQQWRAYAERESPMLDKLMGFWTQRVLPQLLEARESLRDRLCKCSFTLASDAQNFIVLFDSLSHLSNGQGDTHAGNGLDVYLKAQNERLIVEINKVLLH